MARIRKARGTILVFSAALSVIGVGAHAASTIVGSPHDLTGFSKALNHQGFLYNNYNDICIYCHTLQSGTSNFDAWNRPASQAVYKVYESPTLNSQPTAPDMGSSSALCLSCHDGTIAVDNIINRPSNTNPSPFYHAKMDAGSGNCGMCHQTVAPLPGVAETTLNRIRHGFLGTDLSNDHPINLTYDELVDRNLKPIAQVQASGLKLDNQNRVQCASCHDPHVPNEKAFLRKTNVGSQLCTTCHAK